MREWSFSNGITVEEENYNYDLHCFSVFCNGEKLGVVYPDDIPAMDSCINSLDSGNDPITGSWEDGMGNSCTLDGWGEYAKK